MGHESYICGYIKLRDKAAALEAVSRLPDRAEEAQWHSLTSSMFSFTVSPAYRDSVLHFAASFKDILGSWNEWEEKFEAFLSEFQHNGAKLLVEDCYKGDFLVAWLKVPESASGKSRTEKIHRYLDYMNSPEVEFM